MTIHHAIDTHSAALTDIGLSRKSNEDRYVCDDNLKLYVVADGMGGRAAGEVAAQVAVSAVREFVQRGQKLLAAAIDEQVDQLFLKEFASAAVEHAADQVYRVRNKRSECDGMGTTLTMVLIADRFAVIAHVGDSRSYRIRGNKIEQLTSDHTMRAAMIEDGMSPELISRRYDHVLVRSLGSKLEVEVDVRVEALQKGDRFLICSDGLSNPFADENEMLALIDDEDDLTVVLENLVLVAKLAGGSDNLTAVLVRSTSEIPATPVYPLVDQITNFLLDDHDTVVDR